MVEALRHVEDFVTDDAAVAELFDQEAEVGVVGLVASDVLRGQDDVELDAEPLLAAAERRAVDILPP